MIGHIPPVESVTAVGYVPGATVRRTAAVPAVDTGGISVLAAQSGLLATLGGSVAHGTFLNAATERYPATVLGAAAARTVGITQVHPDTQVYLGGQYFTVIGILAPVPLAPEIDESALIGFPAADALLALGGHPTQLYLRSLPDQVQAVASVLPFTANPAQPEAVQISRPSSILVARAAARSAFTALFLALGAVAAAIGGLGDREHHGDLGPGAPRGDRPAARARRDPLRTSGRSSSPSRCCSPPSAGRRECCWRRRHRQLRDRVRSADRGPGGRPAAGMALAVGIGALAGVYPAAKAARQPPAQALRAS